jgi:CDP-4-dehydro-6-deoxyglucose reductase
MLIPPTFDARLVRTRSLSSSVRELVFERADGAPFGFEAGQWVSLVLPVPGSVGNTPKPPGQEGDELRRAYSIASPPDGSPRFELAVTHVLTGPGSTYLHTLAPGSTLKAIGPQGFFTRPLDDARPSLLVATGTGVVPFRSMIKASTAAGAKGPLWLLFGVRTEADVLWRDELEALAAAHPHLRLFVTLSRPHPDEGWAGRQGYVQAHVEELWGELARLASPEAPAQAYVCGLEKMVGAVRELLRKKMGLARQQVHSERYD